MSINESMFSSKSDEWETPQDLFDKLDSMFHFDLDVCATPDNAKVKNYFTVEEDGLKQAWKGTCFMNPPYGSTISKWVEKAYNETRKTNCKVIALLPARTDTKYFHGFIYGRFTGDLTDKSSILFIKGRLKFISKTFPSWNKYGNKVSSAPFPSMIVVWPSLMFIDLKKLKELINP